jgi:hypothetical protein
VSLVVASALLAASAGFVVILPILTRRSAMLRDVTSGHVLDAEARKRVVLNELRELEYEYLGGKLDDADYQALRERVSVEAVEAIRSVEQVYGRVDAAPKPQLDARAAELATHECGFGNPATSRFCAGCGAPLR